MVEQWSAHTLLGVGLRGAAAASAAAAAVVVVVIVAVGSGDGVGRLGGLVGSLAGHASPHSQRSSRSRSLFWLAGCCGLWSRTAVLCRRKDTPHRSKTLRARRSHRAGRCRRCCFVVVVGQTRAQRSGSELVVLVGCVRARTSRPPRGPAEWVCLVPGGEVCFGLSRWAAWCCVWAPFSGL